MPFGVYAISAFHDENLNMALDRHWWGKPKEGVAVSNNVPLVFGEPEFRDAQFDYSGPGKQTLVITLRY